MNYARESACELPSEGIDRVMGTRWRLAHWRSAPSGHAANNGLRVDPIVIRDGAQLQCGHLLEGRSREAVSSAGILSPSHFYIQGEV